MKVEFHWLWRQQIVFSSSINHKNNTAHSLCSGLGAKPSLFIKSWPHRCERKGLRSSEVSCSCSRRKHLRNRTYTLQIGKSIFIVPWGTPNKSLPRGQLGLRGKSAHENLEKIKRQWIVWDELHREYGHGIHPRYCMRYILKYYDSLFIWNSNFIRRPVFTFFVLIWQRYAGGDER